MNTRYVLYHLARADFLERIRRYSFLITLGLAAYVGYTFVPPQGASYVTVAMGDYRGVYNSAWIGAMVAIMTSVFLTLAGFYLVKNAVARDERTGVGQIIAATPISRAHYLFGKLFSNFAVLSTIVGVLVLVAVVMQFLRGEEMQLLLWPLLSPFILMTLPAMLVISALAVLFETVSWLRGGLGNVLYFFLWIGLLSTAIMPSMIQQSETVTPAHDLFGMSTLLADMSRAVRQHFPEYKDLVSVGYEIRRGPVTLQTFQWQGMAWSPAIMLVRLLWIGVAGAITLLAALLFHRFDPAGVRGRTIPRKKESETEDDPAPVKTAITPSTFTLTPLVRHQASSFSVLWRMVRAELRLMLKGRHAAWLAAAVGFVIAGLFSEADFARQWVLPFAWIWPLTLWSAMGTREAQHAMEQVVFSTAHPLRYQFTAMWLAGVIVAALVGSGVAVNLILAKVWSSLFAWMVGTLFIPSLALAAGTWSGSPKLFEAVYVMSWYAGPINRVALLDFMGATASATPEKSAPAYLIMTAILLIVAYWGRRRQIKA